MSKSLPDYDVLNKLSDLNSDDLNRLEVSDKKIAARYYRLQVNDEPGVIAKISSVFGDRNISIEALIQHEAKSKKSWKSKRPFG